jgi:hypothetical protein
MRENKVNNKNYFLTIFQGLLRISKKEYKILKLRKKTIYNIANGKPASLLEGYVPPVRSPEFPNSENTFGKYDFQL